MDIEITEGLGNGGDLVMRGNDVSLVYSFENMVYLGLWGGNKEQSTPQVRIASQQAFDWWGNALLMPNDQSIQFNSLTERTLENIELTSSSRLIIEQAIKTDLAFMKPFAEISVSTAIIAPDHLRIAIGLKKPDNLQETKYIYIWEAGKVTILDSIFTPNPNPVPDGEALQYELQFYL